MLDGLYDPILDDSEDFYLSIEPDEPNQESTPQEPKHVQTESNESLDKTKGETEFLTYAPPYDPLTAGTLDGPIILNLNYKHVFPELEIGDISSEIKFKLPISEQFDPEGKRARQHEIYNKNIIVDYEKIKQLIANQTNVFQTKEEHVVSKEEVYDHRMYEKKEITKESKDINVLEDESNLRKIKQTAIHVIEDSISRALSVANRQKYKNESVQYKENLSKIQKQSDTQAQKTTLKQFNKENLKSGTKKVSFKDDYIVHEEEISLEEVNKREVRVADEIKRFETLDIEMDSKLNVEERKLLTRQDIEEAIEAGTVRQRTGMFKSVTGIAVSDEIDKNETESSKSDIKVSTELTKQKIYNIGCHIIPRIRNNINTSPQSSLMLKKFLVQMTKVMMTLFKFIPEEKRYYFTVAKQFYKNDKESHEYIYKLDNVDDIPYRDSDISVADQIKKPKLSGAKIAQIEGHKPAELTDRMNIVLSEFLKKSGKGNDADKKMYQQSDEFLKSESSNEKKFEKGQTEHKSFNEFSYNENLFDNNRLIEETYESKTQSYEIHETEEEKRYSEYKSTRYDSMAQSNESKSSSRENISIPSSYVAIVEAHVYTNKNAIFEEQKRRMSESMKQSEYRETGIIYYRCEVSVFYRHFREPSLPPTVVIESIEEIPSEEVFIEEKEDITQHSSTDYEVTAKKLAVQKISEVIEPLLNIKEVKSVSIKQAHPTIEMPLKSVSELTTVTIEKEVEKIEIHEANEHKPRSIIEPTTRSIAETNEIFIEEETVGMVDTLQPIALIPQPARVERTATSIAETSEVVIDEANIETMNAPATTLITPRYTIADNLRSIAETMTTVIQEPESEQKNALKMTEETVKVGIDEIIASEVFEVFPEEPVYEEVLQTETTRRQSEVFMEKSILTLPETTMIFVEEPLCETLNVSKIVSKEAKVDINAKVVAEIMEVMLNEKEQDSFEVVKITAKETGALKEQIMLPVGETEITLCYEPPTEPFDLNKFINQQASLTIEESKATEITIVQVEEPTEKTVPVLEQHIQAYMEAMEPSLLTAAENTIVLSEGPHHGFLETFNIESNQPKTIIEGGLVVAQTLTVSPTSPEENFNLVENIHQQANIRLEESKAITTALVHIEEPKEVKLDVLQFLQKKPLATLQAPSFIVPTTVQTVPDGPRDEDLIINKPKEEKADIDIEELKTASVTVVTVEEPKNVNIDQLTYKEKESESLFEKSELSVAVTYTTVPEGPFYGKLDTPELIDDKANIIVEEIRPLTISIVTPNEPQETSVDALQIKDIKPQFLIEDSVLRVVETSLTLPEEASSTFDITKTTSKQAHIEVSEHKAAETSFIVTLESRQKDLHIPEVLEKTPQVLFQSPVFTAAENSFIMSQEKVDELLKTIEPKPQLANVSFRGLRVADTIIDLTEEPIPDSIITLKLDKKESKFSVVDEYLTIANAVIVDIKSAASSPTSSARSSPGVQEYVFGITAGHEYRVQSPQETSFYYIQPTKELYGVNSAEASYTLTFEAAYEDEKELLYMEEISDIIKKNQFWISDIKTMETIESSNAVMQLTNVTVGENHLIHGSAVEVKSRSQSFDTSADFDVNLQALESSEARETKSSDVHAVATFDLKSAASFATTENVESQANVNIKSKSAKAYTAQSVDVAYGLTIENEIEVNKQYMELDVQTLHDTSISKSTKTHVKKEAKTNQASSEIDIKASYDNKVDINFVSDTKSIEGSSSILQANFARGGYASVQEQLEAVSASESILTSKSLKAIEVDASQNQSLQTGSFDVTTQVGKEVDRQQKLALQTDFKTTISGGEKSPSPEDIPSTPLRDVYIFRLLTPAPEETAFIPRDCSFTPESVHEEPLVIVNGMIPHIHTKIKRVLYSPPLDTPPASPSRLVEPVFSSPGLRGGSETPEYCKPLLRGGSETPEYFKPGLRGGSQTPEYFKLGLRGGSQTPEYFKSYSRGGSETPEYFKLGLRGGSQTPEYFKSCSRGSSETPEYFKPGLRGGSQTPEYCKLGLKSGSETPEYLKPGLRSGSETPEFTKEDILEMNRKSALLASAIGRTIRSIEEYKESVGISNRQESERVTKEEEDREEDTATKNATENAINSNEENIKELKEETSEPNENVRNRR